MIVRLGAVQWLTESGSSDLSGSCCVRRTIGRSIKARPLVTELIAAGMFLDDEFANRALARVGE